MRGNDDRFKHQLIQFSTFQSWGDVADLLAPMFDQARQSPASSPVAAQAAKIAAAHADAEGRMLAALRSVQDDVRYVALLLGDADYKPATADQVWAQRFGDCKGKTALLLALLDKLGIAAEPVLASVKYDDMFGQRLPTLLMFDHVFVRAHIRGDTYYLDGTNFGQRALDELRQSPTVHMLPLVKSGDLVTAPDHMPTAPLWETQLTWDARAGVVKDVPFEATLIVRGAAAAEMRQAAADSLDHDKLIEKAKDHVVGVTNDALEYVSTEAEAADGSYIVRFKGKTDLDWTPVEGLKGNRLQFSQSTLTWDGKFDRDDDAGKTIPVLMQFPYWERSTEKILLPNNKDFVVDAKPIDETVAVTHITRAVEMANGVATSVSNFQRLAREMGPQQARNAKPLLDEIDKDYAYVVSRKKLKLEQ